MVASRKGFTLIEIIIVLSILAILLGIAVPMIYRQVSRSWEQATQGEMENLKKAMVGDPKKIQDGVRTDFGYIGDWGGLPENLGALVDAQTPSWSYDKEKKVGAGWNGPYILETFSEERGEYKLDAWNNEYVYSTEDYTNEKGDLVDGKIVSYGPNKAEGGGDDLTIEILKNETTAKVFGYVRDNEENYLPNALATIYFPQNGTLMQDTCKTDAKGYFEFNSIPFGIRSIAIEPRLVYVTDSAKAKNMGKDVEFKIANLSEEDISINSLKAEYSVEPAAYYRKVKIGKKTVWYVKKKEAGAGSGDTVYFESYTITGTGVKREPYTIHVESSRMQVPDIYIAGKGKVVRFELKHFTDNKYLPAKPVDMTGVPFTITFSDGSVINFTPVRGHHEDGWEKEWKDDVKESKK
jgi:prepilin-type N-terminal cleavage/methylation domain-containing protein